jgi:hypothetical protein
MVQHHTPLRVSEAPPLLAETALSRTLKAQLLIRARPCRILFAETKSVWLFAEDFSFNEINTAQNCCLRFGSRLVPIGYGCCHFGVFLLALLVPTQDFCHTIIV